MGKFIISEINVPVKEAYGADIKSIVLEKAFKKLNNRNIQFHSFEKKSIDARHAGNICYVISAVFEAEDAFIAKNNLKEYKPFEYEAIEPGSIIIKRPVVIGAGPCGLFNAYLLAQYGYKPIIIERGKDIERRHSDVITFFNNGVLNTESNIQFGEGGAGAYSDGKLVTRINDPRCSYVLSVLHEMGADESILYDAKPHIGSDVLKTVVSSIRKHITEKGGSFLFDSKVTDISMNNNKICGVTINNDLHIDCDLAVLAIGHSARDTYRMLFEKGLSMSSKPFSMGFRIEHLQADVNECRYKKQAKYIPFNAEYQLFNKKGEKGVYTFCMCPGGFVINASSEEGCLATNGMSFKDRSGINANSAWVVSVDKEDYGSDHPLAGIEYQRIIERKAFEIGRANYVAGVQSLKGFLDKLVKRSNSITPTIRPGYSYEDLSGIYSEKIYSALCSSVNSFQNKLSCFDKGVLTACETRTSSPVSIDRDDDFTANGFTGLYPCGEGAGKAGGIMSAAVDGLKTAESIIRKYKI